MRALHMATALMLVLASAGPVRGQSFAFRLGGGPAVAADVGVTGLVSFEAGYNGAVFRLEGRPAYVPQKLEGGEAALAVGFRPTYRRAEAGPYVLATLSRQGDLREADWATGLGLALGMDFGRKLLGEFLELRYQHLSQDRPRYYQIPPDQVVLLVGLRLGRL